MDGDQRIMQNQDPEHGKEPLGSSKDKGTILLRLSPWILSRLLGSHANSRLGKDTFGFRRLPGSHLRPKTR